MWFLTSFCTIPRSIIEKGITATLIELQKAMTKYSSAVLELLGVEAEEGCDKKVSEKGSGLSQFKANDSHEYRIHIFPGR